MEWEEGCECSQKRASGPGKLLGCLVVGCGGTMERLEGGSCRSLDSLLTNILINKVLHCLNQPDMVSVYCKNHARLLWWSNSKDSRLPMQRAEFSPWAGKFHMPHGIAKKTKTRTKTKNNYAPTMITCWRHGGGPCEG